MELPKGQINFDFSDDDEQPSLPPSGPLRPPKQIEKAARGRKSLKQGEADADDIVIPDNEILFQKQYYPIGEVALMFRVNPSLLRYWESEFGLELRKNRKGDRYFRPEDIKTIQLIYDLLRRRKFTIDGARDFLKKGNQAEEKFQLIQSLQKLRMFLLEIKAHL
jgi:DNA-binding transcriptional MerR regulator